MPDMLSDLITRLRNGYGYKKGNVYISTGLNNLCLDVLEKLRQEGYIRGYSIIESFSKDGSIFYKVCVNLCYNGSGTPSIQGITRISKPSRRVYVSVKSLWKVHKGSGVFILSTPLGILSSREAIKLGVGGELLCVVY